MPQPWISANERERLVRNVVQAVARKLPSHVEREDMLQDGRVAAWREMDARNGVIDRELLGTIVRRRVIDGLRKRHGELREGAAAFHHESAHKRITGQGAVADEANDKRNEYDEEGSQALPSSLVTESTEDQAIAQMAQMTDQERDALQRVMVEHLDARERFVIGLHYWQGVRVEEIANLLNIGVRNAYGLIEGARCKLHRVKESIPAVERLA